jgi:hypothetical protein
MNPPDRPAHGFPPCLLPALAGLLLSGCQQRLTVADQVSRLPVGGAQATIGSRHYRSGPDGRLDLDLPADDRQPVTIIADGYQPLATTAGSLRQQSLLLLDPHYLRGFQAQGGGAPRTRAPCPCRSRAH